MLSFRKSCFFPFSCLGQSDEVGAVDLSLGAFVYLNGVVLMCTNMNRCLKEKKEKTLFHTIFSNKSFLRNMIIGAARMV